MCAAAPDQSSRRHLLLVATVALTACTVPPPRPPHDSALGSSKAIPDEYAEKVFKMFQTPFKNFSGFLCPGLFIL